MPKPNTDGGYLLPLVLDPERRCVQLQIPDDQNHIHAFWGALTELTRWFNWQRDDNQTGKATADIWRDVVYQAWELFESDTPCPCTEEFMADCCDPILAKLDAIISLLKGQADVALIPFRQTIIQSITTNGPLGTHEDIPDVAWDVATGDSGSEILELRQSALCAALNTALLGQYAQVRNVIFGGSLGIAVESLSLITTPWFWLPGTVLILGSITLAVADQVLGDDEARKNIVCCMRDYLSGLAITKANFEAAAAACQVGGNETIMGVLFTSWIQDDTNWGALVHDLGEFNHRAEAGILLECPCEEDQGVVCNQSGTVVGIDLALNGSNGLIVDGTAGSCAGFGTIVTGGASFEGATLFCLRTWQLQRFYGGTTTNEALYAKLTVNGAEYYQQIVPNTHCTIIVEPYQLIGPDHEVRIDLIGGGERMCMTGMRFTGVGVPA